MLPVFQNLNYKLHREDCLMSCTSNKVVDEDPPFFPSSRRVTRRQAMRRMMAPTIAKRFIKRFIKSPCSYREQPRSTRIVVAYPRPAFSATKRTNQAPISFDQQAQVSQGHTSCRKKENCNTEVHGGGGLGLVKSAREPASVLIFVGIKQIVVKNKLFPKKPPNSRL